MSSPRTIGSELETPLLDHDSRPRSPIQVVVAGVLASSLTRRRLRLRLFIFLCITLVVVTVVTHRVASGSSPVHLTHYYNWIQWPFFLHSPTSRFRDALNSDERYITSWINAGWTNDVISLINMVQIALLTKRIPILPPFQPSHAPPEAGFLKFSDVFSVKQLSDSLNIPILEWTDLKDTHSDPPFLYYEEYYGGELEELGCWSVWMTQMARGEGPRTGRIPEALNLEVSYLPIPFGYKNRGQLDVNIHYLSSLGLSSARELAIAESKATYLEKMQETINKQAEMDRVRDPPTAVPVPNTRGNQVDPEDHLLCFDFLYFVSPYVENQRNPNFDPGFELVGKYLRFSDSLTSLSTSYLLRALSLSEGTPLPPLITVHIRRQDWVSNCRDLGVPTEECLAPLSAYARRVDEVRAEMLDAHPEWTSDNIKVMVLSDEPRTTTNISMENHGFLPGSAEAWWASVRAEGWYSIDHDAMETVKKYGEWYPIILDACILSTGHGFVGTDRSTYSSISGQRVAEWQGGPTRTVKWGKIGADDH